jgi:hypothetical protein
LAAFIWIILTQWAKQISTDMGYLRAGVFEPAFYFLSGLLYPDLFPLFFLTWRDLCLALPGVDGSSFSVGSFIITVLLWILVLYYLGFMNAFYV